MFSWLNDPFVCGIIGLAGLIIGVVGIIIAIFFFFKSKTIAKPQYSIENEELVNIEKINKENKISSNNIMLSHGNEVIEYLNKTTIVFSNKGRRTINEEDIANGYFTVSFDSNSVFKPKFIDIRILKCSRESLDISTLILDEKNIEFKFNYLDYKEFFAIEIIHTFDIMPNTIKGDVKGVPNGLKNISSDKNKIIDVLRYSISSSTIDLLMTLIQSYRK